MNKKKSLRARKRYNQWSNRIARFYKQWRTPSGFNIKDNQLIQDYVSGN